MREHDLPFSTSSFEKGFLPEISKIIDWLLVHYELEPAVRGQITSENLFAYLHAFRFRKFMASKGFGNSYFHYLNAFIHKESRDYLHYLKYFFILALKEVIGDRVAGIIIDVDKRREILSSTAVLVLSPIPAGLKVVPYSVTQCKDMNGWLGPELQILLSQEEFLKSLPAADSILTFRIKSLV
jgi:hypothetical protein